MGRRSDTESALRIQYLNVEITSRYGNQVASSGLRVHAIASITKGIETIKVISKIIVSCVCATPSGAVIIHGNGRVMINQISESKTTISSFFFFFGSKLITHIFFEKYI